MTNGSDGSQVVADLRAWHHVADREAARRALVVVEPALRARVPAGVRRRWTPEQVEDVVQGFLERLLARPLPDGIENPAAYLVVAFRNWCLGVERGRKGKNDEPWEDEHPQREPGEDRTVARDEALQLDRAFGTLSIEDRVAVAMVDAPHALDAAEWAWLAQRCGRPVDEVRTLVLACPPVFELTLLFDPTATPEDGSGRRDRMERFRKRRERARSRLRAAMEAP